MDATAHTPPSLFDVKGYPTLYWYPANTKKVRPDSVRSSLPALLPLPPPTQLHKKYVYVYLFIYVPTYLRNPQHRNAIIPHPNHSSLPSLPPSTRLSSPFPPSLPPSLRAQPVPYDGEREAGAMAAFIREHRTTTA